MKKIVILIFIVLLSIIAYTIFTKGFNMGSLRIPSMNDIKASDVALAQKIDNANQLKETKFISKMNELNSATKSLIKEKKSYEELLLYSRQSDIEAANQTQKYDVQFLWTKIGTYATKNGIQLVFDVVEKTNTKEKNATICDLKFTISGGYIAITDFVADLEKDAKLAFTISDFALAPGGNGNSSDGMSLQATFRVKDLPINPDTITKIDKTE